MSEEKLVPKLRFASYSNEWESHKLGDILTFYSTNSFSREKLNYEIGNVKNIHYGDIHTKFPTILSISGNKDVPYINNDVDFSKYKNEQYLQEGDLIIADASEDYADIGKAIEVKDIHDEKVLAGLHTILARDEKNMTINGFKGYLFLTEDLKTNIKRIANGISVLGISKNNLSKLSVNIPTKNEQQKIVDFISAIDKKIELLEDKYIYYQDFKKYLMQQIFAQKLRFDNSSIIQKEIRLGDVISIINKRNKNNDKLPVLSISNKFGFISQTEQFEDREVASSDKKNYKIVNNGEFAYNPARINVGSIAQLKNYDKGIISPMYIVFKIDSNELDPIFFENFLDSDYFRHEMLKRLEGSVRMILSAESLKNIKLTIPSIEEQKKISEIFLSFDKKIDITKYQLDNMKEFKKGLLQQMFVYIVRPILLNFCAKICCIKYFLKLR